MSARWDVDGVASEIIQEADQVAIIICSCLPALQDTVSHASVRGVKRMLMISSITLAVFSCIYNVCVCVWLVGAFCLVETCSGACLSRSDWKV